MRYRALHYALFVMICTVVCTAAQANGVPQVYAPLSPASTPPGGPAFTLSVSGTGFVSGAVVNWNGSARATTFVSSMKVTAAISAADIATAGTAVVSVANPAPGGGTSNTEYFQITNPVSSSPFSNSDVSGPRNGLANVASGDFNGDGKLDLVTAIGPNIFVLPGNGDGSFGNPIATNGPNATILYVFVADLNGDGKPDLVLATSTGTYTALGRGNGTFQMTGFALGDAPATVVFADLNGDGFLDFAYATISGIQVQLGNGDGTFRPGPTTAFGQGYPGSSVLSTGDFNRDGKLDLLVSFASPGCIATSFVLLDYPGNGDGSFGTPSQVPGTSTCGQDSLPSAIVADFNGDGNLDIAYFTQTGSFGLSGFLTVSLGNGDGTFKVPFQPLGQPNSVQGPLVTGDFNGDSILDLVAGNQLFYGQGDGSFLAAGVASRSVQAVLTGDFNGDGMLDLVSVTGSVPDIAMLLQTRAPADFGGSVTPSLQTIVPGGTSSSVVNVVPQNGFAGDVTLSATGLPSGVTANFSPNPVTGGSGSSTMTLTAASNTLLGVSTLTITGTSGSLAHGLAVSLTVNSSLGDFTGTVQPNPDNVTAGGTATYTITVAPTGGYSGNVNLSVSGLPAGATSNLTPAIIPGASGTATLNVFTAASTPQNVYPLLITAASGPLTHTATAYLGVSATAAGWSGSVSPSTQTVTSGDVTSYSISVTPSGGYTGDVSLSVSGLPPGVTSNFPTTLFFPYTNGATLTISVPPGTPAGTYGVLITGTGGGIIHQGGVTLVVN